MNLELALKVQALLDGELPADEQARVQATLEQNADARALLEELTRARTWLQGNELERPVPESREFYWSKIQPAIERAERTEPTAPSSALFWQWLGVLRRHLAPVAGVTLVALLSLAALRSYRYHDASSYLVQVESLDRAISTHTFRSQSDRLVLVWIHRDDAAPSRALRTLDQEEMLPQ
jgi:anti-sigma factor RsiW